MSETEKAHATAPANQNIESTAVQPKSAKGKN